MHSEAIAHPNIALIKYWGNRDDELRIPANGSISLTLAGLDNQMSVRLEQGLEADSLTINGDPAGSEMLHRASQQLDLMRAVAGIETRAQIQSTTNFPMGAGLASSAAAFAALTVAAASALGLKLDKQSLSRFARRGSGSAARSIHGGYVELLAGETDQESYAHQIAPPDHWQLIDLVVLIDESAKHTSSTAGHAVAATSPLQENRVADSPRRLETCRSAILARDFEALAEVVEKDSDLMHSVMMTSEPPLHFLTADTQNLMATVRNLRSQGLSVCYTVDAGPNVHCLCLPESEDSVVSALTDDKDHSWKLLRAHSGRAARVV
ncbi:MAG: diphosphomevalonate decarboxylase [Anaerolineales bacterium]